MCMSPTRTENLSLSLTFLGKKIHSCSVAPMLKQRAWETTCLPSSSEVSMQDSRPGLSLLLAPGPDEPPGNIPQNREEEQRQRQCTIHSTQMDKESHSGSWLSKNRARWKAFKQRIITGRGAGPAQGGASVTQGPSGGHVTAKHQRPSQHEENAADVKIFIPYESAKLCISQIIEDMECMKKRHTEVVNSLEDSFVIASKDNQGKIIQKLRSHYQKKLNTIKRMLDVYQEKVVKKNMYWEERMKTLTILNQKHLVEKTALQEKNQSDAAKWEQEKVLMLELFSSRLDLLHKHQASTLQELQMARLELGQVQDMLKPPDTSGEPGDASLCSTDSLQPETEAATISQSCGNGGDLPLEGAQARLETLKENLYKREREITELLQEERTMERKQSDVNTTQIPCMFLLAAIIQKAHNIYQDMAEVKLLVDHMAEENSLKLAHAKQILNEEQRNTADQSEENDTDQYRDEQTVEEDVHIRTSVVTVQDIQVVQTALECIMTGSLPLFSELDRNWKIKHDCGEPGSALNQEHLQDPEKSNISILGQQFLQLQTELNQVKEDNKRIIENYNSERIMRKKYYNMVEEMKGKIRVFCRIRPMSKAEIGRGSRPVVDRMDDYSVIVDTPRGSKEFQFDKVFSNTSSQEDVFQDVSRLVQSAIDGFNVCIFAYGQTGSGKTYTMVGDKDLKNPGIMSRAFRTVFDISMENSSKFDFKVSMYMLELYNERLLDLFVSPVDALSKKIEIKKDRKGLMFPHGAETKQASSAEELFALFEHGCANRHIAATKMNVESSRSHLIVGITIESRNLTNGSVAYGKLSLVDLAGSERAAKTGAKDDQLKEANSINKALSALGDVIFALSTERAHVPYRNNKLTQLMQDSLGGNAKTLMFVNVSPSSCNAEETLTSLTYATRVKAITNTAQKNSESKEIAQLKEIIQKLKSGQPVDEEG